MASARASSVSRLGICRELVEAEHGSGARQAQLATGVGESVTE
jgi:hypothetical protein